MSGGERSTAPVVVLRGGPSDEELAALVAVLVALVSASVATRAPVARPPAPGWVRPPRYRPAGAWNSGRPGS